MRLKWMVLGFIGLVYGSVAAQNLLDTAEPFLVIQVVDPDGQPIPEARVRVIYTTNNIRYTLTEPSWRRVNANGRCVIEPESVYGEAQIEKVMRTGGSVDLQIEAVAPGYVPVRGFYIGRWQPYMLSLQVGSNLPRPIYRGRTDAQGRIVLKNLYENKPQAANQEQVQYWLQVGDWSESLSLRAGDNLRQYQIRLAPQPGDPAPDVPLKSLVDGSTVRLKQFRSKWVYLEFWATWCGPCQTALQELKSLLDRYGEQWADRLQVITVSVDDTESVVKPHLEQRGWWQMALHCWDARSSHAEEGAANRVYGIRYIPTAFLIDPNGKIVWSGNPIDQIEAVLKRYLGGAR